MIFYVTFPFDSEGVGVPNIPTAGPDSYLTVIAPDEETARNLVIGLIGIDWAHIYTEAEFIRHDHPRGTMHQRHPKGEAARLIFVRGETP